MLVEVVFPDAPADEDFLGRRFEVWLDIRSVMPRSSRSRTEL